jgi:hypothetical protein
MTAGDSAVDGLEVEDRFAIVPECRKNAAGGSRTFAAGVAANLRPDREFFTESVPPPPTPSTPGPIPVECGIGDWAGFVADVVAARLAAGQPTSRWTGPCLDAALQLAVRGRHWPATDAAGALLAVAADPGTRSPMRVAEAGPWWDLPKPAGGTGPLSPAVLEAETVLADLGGLRVVLQRRAREALAAAGVTVNRSTVAVKALELYRTGEAVQA